MTKIENDLESFNRFVRDQLKAGTPDEELADLFDRWQAEHPTPEQHAENVAAIREAIDDYRRGDRGTPAGQHSAELRRRLGISGE